MCADEMNIYEKYSEEKELAVSSSKLTVVYIAAGQLEAQVIKTHLESEGIPAMLHYESAGIVYGITVDGLGEVKVLVPESLASVAREIIKVDE